MLERLVNHLLRADSEQRVAQTECAVCFDDFSETLQATDVCMNHHMVCEPCMYRWAYSQLTAQETPTCPYCREDVSGWQLIDVYTMSGGRLQIAARQECNVSQLKMSITFANGIPIGCIRLVKTEVTHGNPPLSTDMNDTDVVNSANRITMVIRASSALYKLLLDIPRCASAPQHHKCRISDGLLMNPVRGKDGSVYESAAIELWQTRQGDRSPVNGGVLLPLTPCPEIGKAVAGASYTLDVPPPSQDANTVINVNIVCPLNDTTRLEARLGDTILMLVQRVKPTQPNIVTSTGFLIESLHVATLLQCNVNNNDTIYFPSM